MKTILVVEDEAMLLNAYELYIHKRFPDCEVMKAGDGPAAIEVMDRKQPDVMITCLILPGVD